MSVCFIRQGELLRQAAGSDERKLRSSYYRAMHYSAKCGLAIASCLSVRPSVCLSVTVVGSDHIEVGYL